MSYEKVSIFFPNLFEAGMNDSENRIYRFKSFLLNVGERQLFNGDTEVPLTPKTFDVLVHLVENAGRLVRKDDLMQAVWPDSFVEEVNIPRSVHHLRKSLGQDDNGNKFIETVPTKGYRFTMPVSVGETETLLPPTGGPAGADAEVEPMAASQAAPGRSVIFGRPILAGGFTVVILILGGFWYGGGNSPMGLAADGKDAPTNNSGAYRAYLEGKFLLDRRYRKDTELALAKFEEAIRLDPDFTLAYVGKADADWRIFHGPERMHDDIARARASVNKALSLDPNSSYAHTLLCRVNTTYDWDFPAAERACRRAVELDPASHDARHELAMLLNQFGRSAEALAEIDAAIKLAPISFNKRQRAMILFHSKRYKEAVELLEQLEAGDPEFPKATNWLWWFYAVDGDHDKALETYLEREEEIRTPENVAEFRSAYSSGGWPEALKLIVRESTARNLNAVHIAAMHCQLGEKEESFEFLEKALKRRSLWLIHLRVDPRFDPCRDDPRFEAVLKRVGLI